MADLSIYRFGCVNWGWETMELISGSGYVWRAFRSCWQRMAASAGLDANRKNWVPFGCMFEIKVRKQKLKMDRILM